MFRLFFPDACRCGHSKDMHTHYTRGVYCSKCKCGRYRRFRWFTIRGGF